MKNAGHTNRCAPHFSFPFTQQRMVQTIDIYSEITFTTEPSLFLTMFTPL